MSTLYLMREMFIGFYALGFMVFGYIFAAHPSTITADASKLERGAIRATALVLTLAWPATVVVILGSVIVDAVNEWRTS